MKNLIIALLGFILFMACGKQKQERAASATPVVKPPLEIGNSKYIEISKQGLIAIRDGDIDAFAANLSDNSKFTWNYLDSVQGKQAITEYWKDRRRRVIDTLIFSNDVWITLKANEPVAPGLPTGTWVFSWYKATATYKATGKSMTQWVHQIQHFDANDKIDYTTQFLDRAPIQAAMKK